MTVDQKTRQEWERRFPGLDDEWTHWWIEGDGALLAVVSGADLAVALDVVARHHDRCRSIVAHTAKVDSFVEVVRYEKRRTVIASRAEALPIDVEATWEGQCCFCARALVNDPEAIALIHRPSGAAGQSLRCHDECLRALLHRGASGAD